MSQIELNKIHQGDNKEYLNYLIEEGYKFHLILSDPPYNLFKDFGNNSDSKSEDDFFHDIDERMKLIEKLLAPHGSIILFCCQKHVGKIQILLEKYFVRRRMMIWYYENSMSREVKEPVTEFEPFWWFSKDEFFTYNLDDVRIPYKSERVQNPVYKRNRDGEKTGWTPNPKGRKRGDIWQHPTLAGKKFEDEKTEHPTQKPLSLTKDLIRAFCPKNVDGYYEGRILDPYVGSGTTAVAAEQISRGTQNKIDWLGVELEEKWSEVAKQRISNERKKITNEEIF